MNRLIGALFALTIFITLAPAQLTITYADPTAPGGATTSNLTNPAGAPISPPISIPTAPTFGILGLNNNTSSDMTIGVYCFPPLSLIVGAGLVPGQTVNPPAPVALSCPKGATMYVVVNDVVVMQG